MTLLRKLESLGPGDLPTPPSVALKIVHACSDENISGAQIAKIASSDTALLSELLRIVNSPFFGISQKVTTANRAIVVLGNRSLRNFALCFTARESLRPDTIPELDIKAYWEEVLRRAVSARLLAEALSLDADEAFTIGMLQDFGLLAMFLISPEMAKEWRHMRECNPEDRQILEMEIFGATHDAVGGILAKNWGLPEQLILPIANHHSDHLEDLTPELKKMTWVAACADWMAAVFTALDKRLALANCHRLITDYFNIDETVINGLLEKIPDQVIEAANALGLMVAKQTTYDAVVTSANKQLIKQSITNEDSTRHIEKALNAREHLANDIQKAYSQLAKLAYYDPLTTLVNRRRFEDVCKAEIGRHCRSGKEISLIMIDLNNFKAINDQYGHTFGDEALQEVAKILKGSLRGSDLAARLGGDEMCLLLPETDVKGGEIAIQRICKAIAGLLIEKDGKLVDVKASCGGCTWYIDNYDKDNVNAIMKSIDVDEIMLSIMNAADNAMYQSKKSGSNKARWASLKFIC